ncbi:MAG: hypothetical protein M1818_006389 [Claussenomyces sp. TS43310]|nr:MAG: hypothetical protein M1818_006389 [Claussenomyces sp. TS43310]
MKPSSLARLIEVSGSRTSRRLATLSSAEPSGPEFDSGRAGSTPEDVGTSGPGNHADPLRPAGYVQSEPFRAQAEAWLPESGQDEEGTRVAAEEADEEEEYLEPLGWRTGADSAGFLKLDKRGVWFGSGRSRRVGMHVEIM